MRLDSSLWPGIGFGFLSLIIILLVALEKAVRFTAKIGG